MRLKQFVWTAAVLGAAAYAVEGGEYGTSDLYRQARRRRALASVNDSLQQDVDSLQRVKRSILGDPAVQERIAREEFGMVRGSKELLYRFARPDAPRGAPAER